MRCVEQEEEERGHRGLQGLQIELVETKARSLVTRRRQQPHMDDKRDVVSKVARDAIRPKPSRALSLPLLEPSEPARHVEVERFGSQLHVTKQTRLEARNCVGEHPWSATVARALAPHVSGIVFEPLLLYPRMIATMHP